jgi:hypothetical protein
LSIVNPVAIAVGIVWIGAVHLGFVVVKQPVAIAVGTLLEGMGSETLRRESLRLYEAGLGAGRWSQHQLSGHDECSHPDSNREAADFCE